MISMRLEGGDKLAAALRGLSDRVSKSVQKAALLTAGEVIRQRASEMAPRAPGAPDMADHIGMSTSRKDEGDVSIAIGPTKAFFYAGFQEFGTTRHGAQPFLRPAFDSEGRRATAIVSSELWAAIIKRGGGSSRTSPGGGGLL